MQRGLGKRKVNLDIIRIVSMCMIFTFHFFSVAGLTDSFFYRYKRNGGWGIVGTVLFFLLSGFLLYRDEDVTDLREFYRRRMERIYPPLILIFVIGYIIHSIEVGNPFYGGPIWRILFSFLGIDAYLWFYNIDNYYVTGEWFTTVLIFLYIVYPFLNRWIRKHPYVTEGVLFVLFAVNMVFGIQKNVLADASFFTGLFLFGLGMLMKRNQEWLTRLRVMVIPALVVAGTVLLIQLPAFPAAQPFEETRLPWQLMLAISIFFILYVAFDSIEVKEPMKQVILMISNCSYAFYLCHHFAILLAMRHLSDWILQSKLCVAIAYFVIAAAAFAFAYLVTKCVRKFLRWKNQWTAWNQREEEKNRFLAATFPSEDRYEKWLKHHLKGLEEHKANGDGRLPKLSFILPFSQIGEETLMRTIAAICHQTYADWEIVLGCENGKRLQSHMMLKGCGAAGRFRVVGCPAGSTIADMKNRAVQKARGDVVVFLDPKSYPVPAAAEQIARVFAENHDAMVVYTDHDLVSETTARHYAPYMKSGFNYDLLHSENYIGTFFAVRKSVADAVGPYSSEMIPEEGYDYLLRCTEKTEAFVHIPGILYHQREPEGEGDASSLRRERMEKALVHHYARIGWEGAVPQPGELPDTFATRFAIRGEPLVSVIIPNKDHREDLEKCLASIEKNCYKNVEILVVENNSEDPATFAYYEKMKEQYPKVRLLTWEEGFNYSKINNFAAQQALGEYLLFLNNDTQMRGEDCIEHLLGPCQREDVGAVGALLYFPDGSLQHAGVILGLGGVAGYIFDNVATGSKGYLGRVAQQQNYSAVTAACMMMKKDFFASIGAFDEGLAVAYNDIDLCMRILKTGRRILYNPLAQLTHDESKTRGADTSEEKRTRLQRESNYFREKWSSAMPLRDPFFNPYFSMERSDCCLKGME